MDKTTILGTLGHRPFPLPRGPWIMQQTWKDLLFLHYRVPPEVLRDKVPAPLELDTFDGDAWISIAPLNYFRARMSATGSGGFRFRSERRGKSPAVFEVDYAPGPGRIGKSALDEWLVERYRLFQVGIGGVVIEINIHHVPWTLREVDVQVRANTLTTPLGFALPVQQPIAQYSRCQDVLIWPPGLA